jgi:hypothetical protein
MAQNPEKPIPRENGFGLPNMFAQFAEAGKKCTKALHLREKSVINMI